MRCSCARLTPQEQVALRASLCDGTAQADATPVDEVEGLVPEAERGARVAFDAATGLGVALSADRRDAPPR